MGKYKATGYLPYRQWCVDNKNIFDFLNKYPDLSKGTTRYWEYPFVVNQIKLARAHNIIDIGAGDGIFSKILSKNGFNVMAVDNYKSGWGELGKIMNSNINNPDIKFVNVDCLNMNMFEDNKFDIALMISVIEHIPSNMIWCENRQKPKIKSYLDEDAILKIKAIDEALRILKPNGKLIITTDIYMDYPASMNMSWKEMIGLDGVDINQIENVQDLFYFDMPTHKGRILPIGIVIEKQNYEDNIG